MKNESKKEPIGRSWQRTFYLVSASSAVEMHLLRVKNKAELCAIYVVNVAKKFKKRQEFAKMETFSLKKSSGTHLGGQKVTFPKEAQKG